MTDDAAHTPAAERAKDAIGQTAREIRPDLAEGVSRDEDEGSVPSAREKRRQPDASGAAAGSGGGTDSGQEAKSVSEPG